ncbi:DUF4202 domain-containing protein [Tabrizicola aquatica]|uniref:DUF4202 domain-containing protein n=1 Tax=Tabrizicola aquatica TaxID=909926 RepID=UPI000CD1185B|nr:DUF4202 domain-containing protein [Tabrizicola aquatica]
MAGDLKQALAAIDEANAADPKGQALEYGLRMSQELARVVADASEVLQIAARGQHVERWRLPRSDYPEGKEGYLAWRREQARRHAERVADIMEHAGYGPDDCARVGVLLRKEGLKRDAEVQALEDVICLVFLRWYFADFAAKHDPDAVQDIVRKTARKMSAPGRARVLAEFALPAPLAAAFQPE